MEELLIFPYSGTAREALDCLGNQWKCIGFVSDDESIIGKKEFGVQIFDRSAFSLFPNVKVLAVHGSPASFLMREKILNSLDINHDRFASVIHPQTAISANAKIGKNVLIMAGVVITANAVIGDHVVILPNTVIHHDSAIGDLTLVAANATIAGNVQIGKNCYVGASSSIKNGITLGNKTLIGIGANVIHSFPGEQKLVGNPAKPL